LKGLLETKVNNREKENKLEEQKIPMSLPQKSNLNNFTES